MSPYNALDDYELARLLWPFTHSHRIEPGYFLSAWHGPRVIPEIEYILSTDPAYDLQIRLNHLKESPNGTLAPH